MARITCVHVLSLAVALFATTSALPHPVVRQEGIERQNGVKGPTVKYIYFKDSSGNGASLTQQSDDTWTLDGSFGYETGLKESNRDEWSVYFSTGPKFAKGREMSADLWVGRLKFKSPTTKKWESTSNVYEITLARKSALTKSWLADGVNGRTVKKVYFMVPFDNGMGLKSGTLWQTAAGTWKVGGKVEGEAGVKEIYRDEWSVVLSGFPKFSSGGNVLIDLWQGKVTTGSQSYKIAYAQ